MSLINNTMVRRDINRLVRLVENEAGSIPELSEIMDIVNQAARNVNLAWEEYMAVSACSGEESPNAASAIEADTREAYTHACIVANGALISCLNILRSVLGSTSGKYRHFISCLVESGDKEAGRGN